MRNKKNKKKREDAEQNIVDLESKRNEQIEYALTILNRMDSWINSCDNKISILLAILGVALTICLTTDTISKLLSFFKLILSNMNNAVSYIFIGLCGILALLYSKAIYHIINAMYARVDSKKFKQNQLEANSNLFFGSISSQKYEDYKNNFIKETSDEKLNDILSQVYINASIAQIKHSNYNKSLLWLGISCIATLFLIVFGAVAF